MRTVMVSQLRCAMVVRISCLMERLMLTCTSAVILGMDTNRSPKGHGGDLDHAVYCVNFGGRPLWVVSCFSRPRHSSFQLTFPFSGSDRFEFRAFVDVLGLAWCTPYCSWVSLGCCKQGCQVKVLASTHGQQVKLWGKMSSQGRGTASNDTAVMRIAILLELWRGQQTGRVAASRQKN